MQEKIVKVGLVGFGTVGAGVAKILLEDADRIAARTGLRLQLACVVDADLKRQRPVNLPAGLLTNDLNKLINDKSIQIGIELVGGTGVAKEIQLKMLAAGKDAVTANKALLAEYGGELYEAAQKVGRCIAFEASCAGGIPIISGIRTGLAANDIKAMYGIVNGTCNYILSSMTARGEDFAEALAQAKQKGYAEADPTLDISGGDSAHKLAILASIAFGYQISVDDIYVEGIERVSKADVRFGGEMGYVLKLLAIAEKNDDGHISLRVHPSFIHKESRLAQVGGSFNAISILGSAAGEIMFYGRGAGMMPTASAVVADVIDVAMGNSATIFEHLRLKPRSETAGKIDKIDNLVSRFYIRLTAKDRPGVFAQAGKILADNEISISGVLQHEAHGPDGSVPVIITTHPNRQDKVSAALKGLEGLDAVCEEPVCIRIVDIPEDSE
ncbi:MAG: homoserine dehydrogenase [Sedimentisphaerales bacterium]|nr:homoserine dehydrogenase [Sedimentisphaerales bacterium]